MHKEKNTIYPGGLLRLFNEVNADLQTLFKYLLCVRIIILGSGDRMKGTFYKVLHIP